MITTCQKIPLEEDENSTSIVAMGIELYQKRSSQNHIAMTRKESISLQHHRQYFELLLDFISSRRNEGMFVVVSIVIGAIIMKAGCSPMEFYPLIMNKVNQSIYLRVWNYTSHYSNCYLCYCDARLRQQWTRKAQQELACYHPI